MGRCFCRRSTRADRENTTCGLNTTCQHIHIDESTCTEAYSNTLKHTQAYSSTLKHTQAHFNTSKYTQARPNALKHNSTYSNTQAMSCPCLGINLNKERRFYKKGRKCMTSVANFQVTELFATVATTRTTILSMDRRRIYY